MPRGPFGFPRLTSLGPFTEPDPEVEALVEFTDQAIEDLEGMTFPGFNPDCSLPPEAEETCDRIAFLLNDGVEAALREDFIIRKGGTLEPREELQEEDFSFIGPAAETIHRFQNRVVRAAQEAGLEMVGVGSNRFVFTNDGVCVLKVSFTNVVGGNILTGLDENRHAIVIHQEGPEELKRHLVPLKDWDPDGGWLAFPMANADRGRADSRVRVENGFTESLPLVEAIQDALPMGWGLQMGDFHDDQVGLHEGRSVLLDYGVIQLPPHLRPEVGA